MIAIIGAMEEEVKAILDLTSDYKKIVIHDIDFYEATLENRKVIIMKSGIAKCAAAISTTILFENFEIDGVINIGTAGGLDESMQVLDVVISVDVCNYDLFIPTDDPSEVDPRGYFVADENYVKIAKEIIGDDNHVHIGLVATGDTFVCEDEHIARIKNRYPEALCAEMEGSAIAQVCNHYKKPFVIIRSLSDVCAHGNSIISFDEYVIKASERSAKWCKQFIAKV